MGIGMRTKHRKRSTPGKGPSQPKAKETTATRKRHQRGDIVGPDQSVRLNKAIADAGVASRRAADELIAAGKARQGGILKDEPLRLEYELKDGRGNRYRANQVDVPEHQIAIYEDDVRAWHEAAGMRVVEIRYGAWAGREPESEEIGQDLVIAERT